MFLAFSEKQSLKLKKLFNTSVGYMVALDNDGNEFKYTDTGKSYLQDIHTGPNDQVIEVVAERQVQDKFGQPSNTRQWHEWGYNPHC